MSRFKVILPVTCITLIALVGCGGTKKTQKKRQYFSHPAYSYDSPQTEALMKAAEDNDLEKARKAIKKGADVNFVIGHDQPHWGHSPLGLAVKNGSLPMAQLLIDAGANVNEFMELAMIDPSNANHNVRNNPLLSCAVILNNPAMVRLLIEHGADVNKQDHFKKWTPLKIANFKGYIDIAAILKEHGAHE